MGRPTKADSRVRARADFPYFLLLMWRHLGLPPPTRAQYAFAHYLQRGPQRRVLMAFRGVGKSWVTAAFVIWRLWVDPQRKIMVVSASADRAIAFSTFVKAVIAQWPMVSHLQARPGQRDSVENFDVGPAEPHQAPSVKSVGITGQLTGSRAHDIVFDDVEVPKNSETVTMREKLGELVKEGAAVLIPEKDLKGEQTSVTYLGTPQTEDTLYAKLPDRGYVVRVWPARYPDAELCESYDRMGAQLFEEVQSDLAAGAEVGTPTDPKRFDDADLMERRKEYGPMGWALQFMLNPSLSDAERYPLKIRDLVVMDLNDTLAPAKVVWSGAREYTAQGLPSVGMAGDRWQYRMIVSGEDGNEYGGWVPYTGHCLAIDPSGRGPDETAYAVTSFLYGQIFVRELGGFRGDGYSDLVMTKLAHIAAKYPSCSFQIESNFGDGMFTRMFSPVLRRVTGVGLPTDEETIRTEVEVRHNVQKEARIIDSLAPVMGQHKLVIDEAVVRSDFNGVPTEEPDHEQRRCFYQMTRLTYDRGCLKHDDRLDALAMSVKYWTDRMGVDQDQAVEKAKTDAILEIQKRGLLAAKGKRGPAPGVSVLRRFGL